ncbi:hypothetical protein L6V77_03720 [Myxococcota bacterium]|nr:hypothetical protein [Myxococcota bacterium]
MREIGAPRCQHSARVVPISTDLANALISLTDEPSGRLFPCPFDREYHFWRHRMHQAQKKAGIRRFSFHELRRAVADRMRRGGVTVDVYCKFMGPAPITGLRHDSTVVDDGLREAHDKALKSARRRLKPNM